MGSCDEKTGVGVSYFSAVPGAYINGGKGASRLKSVNDSSDSTF